MKNPMSQRVNISFSDLILRLSESAVCGSAQSTNSVTQSSPTFSKISRQLASTFRAGPVGQKLLRNLTTNHNFTEVTVREVNTAHGWRHRLLVIETPVNQTNFVLCFDYFICEKAISQS